MEGKNESFLEIEKEGKKRGGEERKHKWRERSLGMTEFRQRWMFSQPLVPFSPTALQNGLHCPIFTKILSSERTHLLFPDHTTRKLLLKYARPWSTLGSGSYLLGLAPRWCLREAASLQSKQPLAANRHDVSPSWEVAELTLTGHTHLRPSGPTSLGASVWMNSS